MNIITYSLFKPAFLLFGIFLIPFISMAAQAQEITLDPVPQDLPGIRDQQDEMEEIEQEAETTIEALGTLKLELENAIRSLDDMDFSELNIIDSTFIGTAEKIKNNTTISPDEKNMVDSFANATRRMERNFFNSIRSVSQINAILENDSTSILQPSQITKTVRNQLRQFQTAVNKPLSDLYQHSETCSNLSYSLKQAYIGNAIPDGDNRSDAAQTSRQYREEIGTLLTGCANAISEGSLMTAVGELKDAAKSSLALIDVEIENAERLQRAAKQRSRSLQKKLDDNLNITGTLSRWVLPVLAIIIVILLWVPKFYSDEVQTLIFNRGLILKVLTVFLLVAAILILGLADKIPTDALGTLLAGISGYVLGSQLSERTHNNGDAPPNPAPAPDPNYLPDNPPAP